MRERDEYEANAPSARNAKYRERCECRVCSVVSVDDSEELT